MIQLQNVCKTFGSVDAVRNVSLCIPKGEFFAFLGPNAAGKTTTIKLLTGLLRPTSGTILIGEKNIAHDPIACRKSIGYVPDMPYLYDKLTPREHVAFVLDLYKIKSKEALEYAEELFEYFSIGRFADTLIENLSHGTRQKVVFVCLFAHAPSVIIVDEPMVGLDPESAWKIKKLLKDKANEGAVVFMSTHTLSDAEEIADRIGIIDNGNLIAVGSLLELKDRYGENKKLEELFFKITKSAIYNG